MRGTIPQRSGDERDAFTRWRKFLSWRKGVLKKIKRGYNKRVRRVVRRELKEASDHDH